MMQFDHIGVFVPSLSEGRETLKQLLPIVREGPEIEDNGLKVAVQFLYDRADICYELVAPLGVGNPVDPVLSDKKNILNHIAYQCTDFDDEITRFREQGAVPLGPPQPAKAFGGARVVFFLTPLRMIVELIEAQS